MMAQATGRLVSGRPAKLLVALILAATNAGWAQLTDAAQSPLLRPISSQSPSSEVLAAVISGCGQFQAEKRAAQELAALGSRALPDLTKALQSVAANGEASPYAVKAGSLLLVFAQIEGRGALPTLLSMISNARLRFLGLDLDHAAALALSLTSYVTSDRYPGRRFHCARLSDPRDTLDQVILAWEQNDQRLLESSLGPAAEEGLHLALKRESWDRMRVRLLGVTGALATSLGYRFDTLEDWSSPEETLDQTPVVRTKVDKTSRISVGTSFSTRFGASCGNIAMVFDAVDPESATRHYVLDNGDMISVLDTISSCIRAGR